MREWKYGSKILDLGTRWRRAVIFTLLLHYRRGKEPPGIDSIGGLAGPGSGLDTVE
jgi:hypothetical protein